ncbi:extracellular solute-binding protein, partial [Streptomyces althioticus]
KVLLALGNATPWVTQLITYALVATTVYADEPDFDTDMELGKETFANSGWRTALRKYMEMDGRGCFNADPLDTTYEETLDQVATGRAVGVVQVASVLSELRAAAPGLTLRMTALPATDDPDDTRMPGAVSAAYGLNPDTRHRKEAFAFIDFLGSARGQNLYNRSGATLPAIPNPSFTVDSAIREVAERQKAGTTVPFMDQRWPNSAVQQTHFAQVKALFSGITDIGGALSALDKAYRERP